MNYPRNSRTTILKTNVFVRQIDGQSSKVFILEIISSLVLCISRYVLFFLRERINDVVNVNIHFRFSCEINECNRRGTMYLTFVSSNFYCVILIVSREKRCT